MATLTSQLIVSLLDRVSAPSRAIAGTLGRLRDQAAKNSAAMNAMRGQLVDATAAGYLLARALSAPIKAASEFQSAMADVNKVVDFETPDGLATMSRDILALTRTIPMAATGIAEIVAAAGQAGMAGNELLTFAEMAAKVGVAFDVSAGEVGESLSKIKTALGLTVPETSKLADALNHLSNTSASSAPDLLDFMRRVGSIGKQYGFTAEQTAAIGSAMVAAGAQADVAATSFRNVGKALARGESASKRQREAFAKLGLDAQSVAVSLQRDAVGTLNDVIELIRALPKEVQASTVSDLFGDEARAIMPLIENAALLKQALSEVADETNYLGSAQKEFEVRAQTFENSMQILKNGMREVAIAIGDSLLPALTSLADAVAPYLAALAEVVSQNPQAVAAVVALASGLVALRVATIAARFAFLFMKGGALSAAIGVTRAAGLVTGAAGAMANFARMVRGVGLSMTLLSATGGGGIFGALTAGATAAAAALAAVSAPVWAAVAAVAAVALAIYNYWEPISGFVSGFVAGVGSALGGLVELLAGFGGRIAAAVGSWATDRLIDVGAWLGIDEASMRAAIDLAVSALVASGRRIVDTVRAIPAAVAGWISDIFTINDYSDQAEAGFRDAGARAGRALVDAIIGAFDALWTWLKELPGRIVSAIGNIDLSGMIKMPSLSSLNPFGGGSSAPAVEGARAAGGSVVGGRTYLVGERGAELFTPGQSGYVHDAATTAGAFGAPAAAAAPSVTVSFGDIVVQGVQDAEAVAREIGQRLREEIASLQADLEYSVS